VFIPRCECCVTVLGWKCGANVVKEYIVLMFQLFRDQEQLKHEHNILCLGTIVNGNNILEEEIRERIAKGNKAFYANKSFLKVTW